MSLFAVTAIAAAVGWLLVVVLALWLVSLHRLHAQLAAVESASAVAAMARIKEIQSDLDASKASVAAQSAALDAQAKVISQASAEQFAKIRELSDDRIAEELRKKGIVS